LVVFAAGAYWSKAKTLPVMFGTAFITNAFWEGVEEIWIE
jgi:hypothetical protein